MAKLPNGCRERKDGMYEIRFTVDSKRYSVYANTPKACKEKELALRQEIAKGTYTKNKDITLEKYYEEWIKQKRNVNKGNTLKVYSSYYRKRIKPVFGKRILSKIERREIIKFRDELLEVLKPTTVNVIMIVLSDILNDAVKDDILQKNPCKTIKRIKNTDKKARDTYHRALSQEEQSLFINTIKGEYYEELIMVMLMTGMRIGEATALTWSDIDYKNNVIHVNTTATFTEDGKMTIGTPKSELSSRDIPMNEDIKRILKSQRDKVKLMRESGVISLNLLVFPAKTGAMLYNTTVNEFIERMRLRICDENGIVIDHFTAHSLRDTFATRYIEQGGTPQTLKTILGHSSLSMTMDLYAHVLPNTKQEEMSKIRII